ncbi:MAG TPA: hypothetical protein VG227_08440 [Caulobacteraceae bacterium]|nr:hypothetical protein [Caulobacteraceae bacterium]
MQSGTFLIALALLWPKLAIWTGLAAPLGHSTWIAFWTLEVGMVIAAFAPPAREGATAGGMRRSAAAFQALGALVMFIALAALLFTFGPVARLG